MNNTQFFLSVSVPTLAILVGMVVNAFQVGTINAQATVLARSIAALEGTISRKLGLIANRPQLRP